MKNKETLKEAAKEYLFEVYQKQFIVKTNDIQFGVLKGFESGAKWQQERSFSYEQVYKMTLEALDLGMQIRQYQLNGYSEKSGKELHKEWFEQLKKK